MLRQNTLLDRHRKETVRISLSFIALLSLCFLSTACSGFYAVGFVSNPGGTNTISGTVSMVNLGFIQDVTGVQIQFTGVTFINPGTATTINFCGDQRNKFRINSSVQATFASGVFCANLTSIVVATGIS
jgi:hypothetical protein